MAENFQWDFPSSLHLKNSGNGTIYEYLKFINIIKGNCLQVSHYRTSVVPKSEAETNVTF